MESLETQHGVLLRDDRGCALFAPDSMRLFSLDVPARSSLGAVALWLDTQLPPRPGPPPQAEDGDPLHLSYREALLPIMTGGETLSQAGIKPKINRLTLNISNACNLFCSYCYADYGHYHSPRSYMPVERALQIIERLLDMYREVDIVHYFGGEPLLNPNVIDAVGEAFRQAHESGRIPKTPQFVATTNGTLASEKIIELLQKWGIELTVSWDGPKEIHDRMRPLRGSGGSSYDKLVEATGKYRERGIGFEIECTYNIAHLEAGVSVVDLMQFFHERTGLEDLHIAPACLPDPDRQSSDGEPQKVFQGESLGTQLRNHVPVADLIPVYREAAAETVSNMFQRAGPRLTLASSVVEQICKQRRTSIYCPAFFNQLSIATDGTAYPCFMFIGDKRFNLGNVLTDVFPTKDGLAVFRSYFDEFGMSPSGTEKWFAPLFSGCVAGEYIASNDFGTRSMEPLYRAMIEECLLGVALCSGEGAAPEDFGRGRAC